MKSRATVIAASAAVCFVLIVASIAIGTESINLLTAFNQWRLGAEHGNASELNIVMNLRLPRTLLALLAGGGLALAGCAFQALLRNPLATPYTLGIDSFAALGAYMATVFGAGTAMNLAGFSLVQVAAFFFAAFDVFIIYAMAARARRMSPMVLLLAGVTLGLLANSGILFLRYLAKPEQLINMDRWLMGGVIRMLFSARFAMESERSYQPFDAVVGRKRGKDRPFSVSLRSSRGAALTKTPREPVDFRGANLGRRP